MAQGLTEVVDRNVQTLMRARHQEERNRGTQEKIADRIGHFTGSLPFVYLHFFLFAAWLILNSGWVTWMKPWDPYPFVMLAMAASVEAIFLSTFVLINQNRSARLGEKRAELDVQINLLTEHELTRLIQMVDAISKKLNVTTGKPADLEEIKKDIPPELVMARIDHVIQKSESEL